ncbi:MAG: protein kinase, partial [Candidatus Aminicenantes bacterium]|nr:protein kinase [Candidatus Aminicenantes bacterium]
IIHRDLKPSNIMIDKEGNARIMDFGIARSLKAEKRTGSGMMIGTPEYMSPEQVDGKEVDQRSDIYSMGIILYEMVTGRVPFEGETALSIAMKQKSESPKDPTEFNIRIPEDLSCLILKCLNKTKSDRFQSAEEILAELSNIDSDLTTTERTAFKKESDTKERQDTEWKNSIAVLPFVDISPQKDQEYFCDGMAEELINSLTKIKDLRVVARTSAFAFKGEKSDIREIGQKLNVKTVLEGSVRKAGNRLRIMAQLINIEDGFHIWSDKYDRDMDDVFAIQDEISLAIVENLKGKLLGEEKAKLTKRHTVDVEAYKLYLKGLYFWNKRSKEWMEKGMKHFEQAIELDPSYAQAYCGLADSFSILSFWTFLPPKDGFPKAIALAKKALEIDGTLAEAHVSLAFPIFLYEWDWAVVEKEFKLAIQLNPGLANAHHWYSIFLSAMERHEEALSEIKKALDLDPMSLMINMNVGTIYHHMRHYDKAVEVLKKTSEMDPNFGQAHYSLARVYMAMEKYDETVSESLIAKKQGILWAAATQGFAYGKTGHKDKAGALLQELKVLSKTRYVPSINFAFIYAGLDEIDKAFEWVDKGFEEREIVMPFLKVMPDFACFRSDPRFEKLLKKLNLV